MKEKMSPSKQDGVYCFDGTTSGLMEGIERVAGDFSGNIFGYTADGEILPINRANAAGNQGDSAAF